MNQTEFSEISGQKPLDRLLNRLARHPYIVAAAACLLLLPFGFGQKEYLTGTGYIYLGAVIALLFALFIFGGRIGKNNRENAAIFACCTALEGFALLIAARLENPAPALFWISVAFIALIALALKLLGSLGTRNLIMLMMLAGLSLRFLYVFFTDSGSRQHDVGFWNWTWGHANYIEYWYQNGLKLPDFDVRSIWQYYHPPLHHWLMAALLKILTQFGVAYETACQALQILPMLYSTLIMTASYRLFRWVKLSGLSLVIAMGVIAFHPTFVIMGGFFNNDTLSVLFMMLAVNSALKWYHEPTLKNIIPIAICVGLGMMTKLSAWMVAPAIAFFFLLVFFRNLKKWKGFLGQFVVFGMICAPLGLWWQVRNLIAFNVPLTYVPYLSEQDVQYCGDLSPFQRLFDCFSGGQLSYVYDAFTAYGAPYNEFNPTLGLFKTATFGEGTNGISVVNFPQIAFTGPVLFWSAVVLFLLAFGAFIFAMVSKKTGVEKEQRIFFSALMVTLLLSYYIFCFKFPFTCTMNIRYCVSVIPLCVMGLGLTLRYLDGRQSIAAMVFRWAAYAFSGLFALMSAVVFTQIA